MRTLLLSLSVLLLLSCSSNTPSQESISEQSTAQTTDQEEAIAPPSQETAHPAYALLGSSNRVAIETLDMQYGSTPFTVRLGNKDYYIVCTGRHGADAKNFDGTLKYGVVGEAMAVLLEPIYDKVYNPNLVQKNCFEIKLEGKIGLFNYVTGEVLAPQFDYLLPAANAASEKSYGAKDQKWYEISNSNITSPKAVQFDPTPVLKRLSFNIMDIGENMMLDSYHSNSPDDPFSGRGVVIVPSYVEYFHLLYEEVYADVILPDQLDQVDFGTEQAKLSTSEERTLTDRIISFVVSVYESGIDARGYQVEAKELIVYNQAKNSFNSVQLSELNQSEYFCRESDYRFVNDSIMEVRTNVSLPPSKEPRYEFETKFNYLQIDPQGNITELSSNRHYDFTKFIYIDESNFKGCFAWVMEGVDFDDEYNMWMSDHLRIEDLDVMRNEIFAEYGYKFKSEKWQQYFASKPWYKPLYDNVDDQLSEMEKANIQLILKFKEQMKGNEAEFIHKRKDTYVAAG